jgi:hypothetical protein
MLKQKFLAKCDNIANLNTKRQFVLKKYTYTDYTKKWFIYLFYINYNIKFNTTNYVMYVFKIIY